jgi:cell division protein FtsA
VPQDIGGLVDIISNPIYTTGVGLVKYGFEHQEKDRFHRSLAEEAIWARVWKRMKEWIQEFF